MSFEANKQLVQRFYDAIGRREFTALHNMCHKDFVFYNQIDTPYYGVDGLIESEKKNFDAFENYSFPIIHMVAEGDKVAAYMTFEGKNQIGPCVGAPPKGNHCRFSLMMLLTIADGKIIEKRAHFDAADIRRQLTV